MSRIVRGTLDDWRAEAVSAGGRAQRGKEKAMRIALRSAIGLGVVAMLVQGCAGGAMQSTQSVSSGPGAPSYGIYGTERFFKVEWQADERRGMPIVSGYVTNDLGLGVRNVRMRVEALDAAGVTTANHIGYVSGVLTPGSRYYFEVPVPAKAPSYRVTVLSYDPVQGHN